MAVVVLLSRCLLRPDIISVLVFVVIVVMVLLVLSMFPRSSPLC